MEKSFKSVRENITSRRGITCLSELCNDSLMWAYYGGGHTGLCLEFDSDVIPFNKAIKVKYTNKFHT